MNDIIVLDLSHPRDRNGRTDATLPSHKHDTGSSYYISYSTMSEYKSHSIDQFVGIVGEIEVITNSIITKTKPTGRFLKGPIPLEPLAAASCLPGKALAVYIALRHRCDLEGKSTVSLPAALLRSFGVDRDAKARALRVLEQAGLVHVERSPGRAARIALKSRFQTA